MWAMKSEDLGVEDIENEAMGKHLAMAVEETDEVLSFDRRL